jgi:Alpha amylase, catalytic domain
MPKMGRIRRFLPNGGDFAWKYARFVGFAHQAQQGAGKRFGKLGSASPCFRSPMRDLGYDIADHCDIDPSLGTLADFDRMLEALHARDIRLILDFVPNHTASEHPWFAESADRPPIGAEAAAVLPWQRLLPLALQAQSTKAHSFWPPRVHRHETTTADARSGQI